MRDRDHLRHVYNIKCHLRDVLNPKCNQKDLHSLILPGVFMHEADFNRVSVKQHLITPVRRHVLRSTSIDDGSAALSCGLSIRDVTDHHNSSIQTK